MHVYIFPFALLTCSKMRIGTHATKPDAQLMGTSLCNSFWDSEEGSFYTSLDLRSNLLSSDLHRILQPWLEWDNKLALI